MPFDYGFIPVGLLRGYFFEIRKLKSEGFVLGIFSNQKFLEAFISLSVRLRSEMPRGSYEKCEISDFHFPRLIELAEEALLPNFQTYFANRERHDSSLTYDGRIGTNFQVRTIGCDSRTNCSFSIPNVIQVIVILEFRCRKQFRYLGQI